MSDDVITPAVQSDAPAEGASILGNDQPDGPDYSFVPDKHRALNADGEIDLDATLRRVDRQRVELERRMSIGDLRPKTSADYAIDLGEERNPYVDALGPELVGGLREKAFALGLTPSQFNGVLGEFVDMVPTLGRDLTQHDRNAAEAELRQAWPTEREYQAGVQRSMTALQGYAGEQARALMDQYGNDSKFIQAWAAVGAEMGEDRSPANAGTPGGRNVGEVMRSEAYTNASHPDHAKVSREVAEFFKASYTDNPAMAPLQRW